MALAPGTRLGIYEVVARLGAGGMGEVYRARDARLGRDVAIKVLPPEVSGNAERLARFRREATLLAALNHPNVAAIHGLEESDAGPFLVLELVEGVTLAQRLDAGPLDLLEVLALARQVASALAAAHERGIIHRDLKPSNLALSPSGGVKLLDFGLAKTVGASTPPPGSDGLTTITTSQTAPGMVLGTGAYMSPEQARGAPLDERTDIWSFGCVLFEALTGVRPFRAATIADTMVAILEREPDWTRLPAGTPAALRRVLERCLEKDRTRRFQRVRDVDLETATVPDAPAPALLDATAAATVPQRGSPRFSLSAQLPGCTMYLAAASLAVVTLGSGLFVVWRSGGTAAPEVATGTPFPEPTERPVPAATPDERRGAAASDERRAAATPTPSLSAAPAPPIAAAPGAAASPAAANEAAVRSVLRDYARAIGARDIERVRRVWPAIPDADARRLERAFRRVQSWRVDIAIRSVTFQGDRATVRVLRRDVANGTQTRRSAQTFGLVRRDGGLRIDSITRDGEGPE